jgi:hypothetical protein
MTSDEKLFESKSRVFDVAPMHSDGWNEVLERLDAMYKIWARPKYDVKNTMIDVATGLDDLMRAYDAWLD